MKLIKHAVTDVHWNLRNSCVGFSDRAEDLGSCVLESSGRTGVMFSCGITGMWGFVQALFSANP